MNQDQQKSTPSDAGCNTNTAYILLKCKLGREEIVIDALKGLEGVQEIDQIYGTPYDIIIKVVSGNVKELDSLVKKIRRTNEIVSTQTMLVGGFA
jgi:DNA-binding Lrp family transcriptional regulator